MTKGIDIRPGSVARRLAHRFGVTRRLAARTRRARILMFHGIGDERHSATVFERQVGYLSRYFNIVSLDRLLDMLDSGVALKREVVLTFDDGLRNNALQAYPVLEKYKAPATFYVCPGLIETGEWLWNHEARARLKILSPQQRADLLVEPEMETGVESIIASMKRMPMVERMECQSRLRQKTGSFTATEADRIRYDMMSWDELHRLDSELVTVGAHTMNHVIARGLDPDDLQLEITECQRMLEARLQQPVRHFCYPNGDFDAATLNAVKLSYASAVTVREGLIGTDDDRFELNRIPSADSVEYLSWRLLRPGS